MRRMIALAATTAAVALVAGLWSAPALAEESTAKFMVSPAKLEFEAVPGHTESVTVQVANQGDVPLHITTTISDYAITPQGAFTFTEPGHESYSSSAWISVDELEFDLVAGEIREVEVIIVTPKNAELGGHYAAVLFSSANKPSEGTGVQVVSRVGSLILATVGDDADIVRSAQIASYDLDASWFKRTSAHIVTVENSGNVHVTIRGSIALTDLWGRKVGSIDLPGQTVLPDTKRQFPAAWKTPIFGRFTAAPELKYGPDLDTFDTKMKVESITFWIIPWHLIVALVIGLGLAGVWAKSRSAAQERLRKARQLRTARREAAPEYVSEEPDEA